MTPHEWILSADTGISSKSIWAVMMGVINKPQCCDFNYNTPSDPSDFGRCYRLLIRFRDWRKKLDLVGEMLPKWKPMIERWSELESLWEQESPSGKCPQLYELMQEINEKCMIADGWIKDGTYSWKRDPEVTILT